MTIKPEQTDYMNYTYFFKSNYRKGVNRLKAYASSENLKNQLIESRPALDSIFTSNDAQSPYLFEALSECPYGSDISNAYIKMLGAEDIVGLLDTDVSDQIIIAVAFADNKLKTDDLFRDSFFDHSRAVEIFGTNANELSDRCVDSILSKLDSSWFDTAIDSKEALLEKNVGFSRGIFRKVVNEWYPNMEFIEMSLLSKISPFVEANKDVFKPWVGKSFYFVTSERNYFSSKGIPHYSNGIGYNPATSPINILSNDKVSKSSRYAILVGLAQDKTPSGEKVGFTFMMGRNAGCYVSQNYVSSYTHSERSNMIKWSDSNLKSAMTSLYNAMPDTIKPYMKQVTKSTLYREDTNKYTSYDTNDYFFLPSGKEIGLCANIYNSSAKDDKYYDNWWVEDPDVLNDETSIKAFDCNDVYDFFRPIYDKSIEVDDFVDEKDFYSKAFAPGQEEMLEMIDDYAREEKSFVYEGIRFRHPRIGCWRNGSEYLQFCADNIGERNDAGASYTKAGPHLYITSDDPVNSIYCNRLFFCI